MPNRAQDRLKQAFRNLEQAEDSRKVGPREWACFAAQQAAKKAVKALHLFMGQEAWGHVSEQTTNNRYGLCRNRRDR